MKEGDVITKINGQDVNTSPELQEAVSRYHPGDKITVTFNRDGKEKTITTALKNKENNTSFIKKEETTDGADGTDWYTDGKEGKEWERITNYKLQIIFEG
jgi:C-terminal processing protease CtpA/Prc